MALPGFRKEMGVLDVLKSRILTDFVQLECIRLEGSSRNEIRVMTTRKSGPDHEGPSSGVGVGLILCEQVKNVSKHGPGNLTVLSGRVECRWWEGS